MEKQIVVKETAAKKEGVRELVDKIGSGEVKIPKSGATIGEILIKKIGKVITLM